VQSARQPNIVLVASAVKFERTLLLRSLWKYIGAVTMADAAANDDDEDAMQSDNSDEYHEDGCAQLIMAYGFFLNYFFFEKVKVKILFFIS
jgi:hypothetical protein